VRCPNCGDDHDRVVDSRPAHHGAAVRRRRECHRCTHRFTTFERIEQPGLTVRKRSGVSRPFSRDKVLDGMLRASKGRVGREPLEVAAAAVEQAVRELGVAEVSSEQVGLRVLAELRALDPVAYVRFASVYKGFEGPEDFESELLELRKDAPPKPRAPDAGQADAAAVAALAGDTTVGAANRPR
jgi:transcriptional repressor NrdR